MGAGNCKKVHVIDARSINSRPSTTESFRRIGTDEECLPKQTENTDETRVKCAFGETDNRPCHLIQRREPCEGEEDTEVLKLNRDEDLTPDQLTLEEIVKPDGNSSEETRIKESTSIRHVQFESGDTRQGNVTSDYNSGTITPIQLDSDNSYHALPFTQQICMTSGDRGDGNPCGPNRSNDVRGTQHEHHINQGRVGNENPVATPQEENSQNIVTISVYPSSEPTIKRQFMEVIKSYRDEDNTFVETVAFKTAKDLLVNNHFLTLVGKPGAGKTAIARHLLLTFFYDRLCEEPVLVTTPDDWKKLVDVKKRQFVLIENVFGFTNLSQERLDLWGPILDMIHRVLIASDCKLFVVFTCRHHILMDAKKYLEDISFFMPTNIVNLTDERLLLTLEEKRNILQHHVKGLCENDIEIIVRCNLPHGYPYCCKMFATNETFRKRGAEFFKKPKEYIKEELNRLRLTDKVKFCVLVLCMLNDGHISMAELDFSRLKQKDCDRLKAILRITEVPIETSSVSLIETLENLTSLYLLKTGTVYSFLHPCLLETVAEIMANFVTGEVINLCSWTFIQEKVRTSRASLNPDSFTIVLEPDDNEPLAIRLSQEVLEGRIKSVVQHQACGDENFIRTWIKTATDRDFIIDLCLTVDSNNRSLLYWAAWSKNIQLFKYLFICCKPDVTKQKLFDEQKSMMLLVASFFSLREIVDIIVSSVVNIYYQDHIEPRYTFEKYLVYGFRFGRLLYVGPTILHAGVCGGNLEIVRKLIDYNAPVNQKDRDGGTPIHAAACSCVPEIVESLICAGADKDAQDINGWTALHIVAGAGYVKDDDSSLEKMFNISGNESRRQDNTTNLYQRQSETARLLMKNGASMKITDYEKQVALHVACVKGNSHIVEILLKGGCDVDVKNGLNLTPLHLSAEQGFTDICKILIEYKANVNESQLTFRNRPIHYAAWCGHLKTIKLLTSLGADINVSNSDNKTALDIARERQFDNIVKYLSELENENAVH